MNSQVHETCELRLSIPELAEETALGSGCCFATLGYLVQEELRGWFGMQEVELVPPDQVRVTMDARRHPDVSDLIDTLLDLGLSEVRAERC